jgi:DNA end-binding protein Ku
MMAPRASWTGFLRLSLVTIPVRLYNAVTSTSRVSLNQLHKNCNLRLRQQMVCPEHGAVGKDEIVKGYQFEKDKYVVIDNADLQKIKLETTKTIELIQFVDANELDLVYLNTPYYVTPEGPVAEESFRIVREAMREANKVGIGQVVMLNREQVIALRVQENGFTLNTLHYAEEVRNAQTYFGEIKNGSVDKSQLSLARQLVNNLTLPFDPGKFVDHYQNALLEIVKAKIEGSEPVLVQKAEHGKVINLMDALKQSLARSEGTGTEVRKKPAAASVKTAGKQRKQRRRA